MMMILVASAIAITGIAFKRLLLENIYESRSHWYASLGLWKENFCSPSSSPITASRCPSIVLVESCGSRGPEPLEDVEPSPQGVSFLMQVSRQSMILSFRYCG
jgi:hypothetical protein